MKPAKKTDLEGASTEREVCLLYIGATGTLWLSHIEADVVDDDTGEKRGRLLFNGSIKLPLSKFEFDLD